MDHRALPTQVTAAERLDSALERIARAATAGIIRAGRADAPAADIEASPEAIERLEALIARLRAALEEKPEAP